MKIAIIAIVLLASISSGFGQSPGSNSTANGPTAGSNLTQGDIDVLYLVYQLEFFESSFYCCASSGTPLSSNITGGGPPPSSCPKAKFANATVASFAAELCREETAHTNLLFNALKAAAVSPVAPTIDINAAFTAVTATATGTLTSFNAYGSDLLFLHAAFIFEDAGASGYLGALDAISSSAYRRVAAQIGNTEAYHSSAVRTMLYENANAVPVPGFTVRKIADAIVIALNKVTATDGGLTLKYSIDNISNVDFNGLVPYATPQQVLALVTLGAAPGSGGGFFPNNLNGNIKN